jgi:hypothetical protein
VPEKAEKELNLFEITFHTSPACKMLTSALRSSRGNVSTNMVFRFPCPHRLNEQRIEAYLGHHVFGPDKTSFRNCLLSAALPQYREIHETKKGEFLIQRYAHGLRTAACRRRIAMSIASNNPLRAEDTAQNLKDAVQCPLAC